jgi:hypothetical protein
MKGKTTSLLCFLTLLAAGSSSALARLGETSQAIEDRYGPPLSSAVISDFTRCQYLKQSYVMTIFYKDGHSVLEIFAKRGFVQDEAGKVVSLVAAHPVDVPDATKEDEIRQAAGITCKDVVFWTWAGSAATVDAAFNPTECTLAFFSDPAVYARVQQALASDSITDSGGDEAMQRN